MEEVGKLFKGELDVSEVQTVEERDYGSVWGEQHCDVMKNFADAVLNGAELLAPGSDGINGVRLANAIHLSSWTGKEVDMVNFDEEAYLAELNKRIEQEGKFDTRS